MSNYLTVIIPAYNEEKNIEGTMAEVLDYLSRVLYAHEIMIVDDGSKDSTLKIVEALKLKNPSIRIIGNEKNMGKGYTVRKGMLEASGEHILFMDADNSTSIKELDKFLPYLKDYDIVIGSRCLKESDIKLSSPPLRIILGKFYIWLSRFLIKSGVSDYNCGFKLFNRDAASKIFSKQLMNDWSYDTEDIFLAGKLGFRIKEVPITWRYKSTSKVRPIRDGIKSLISLVVIKINDLKGKYRY